MEFDMTKPVPETQPWSEKFWEGTKTGQTPYPGLQGL